VGSVSAAVEELRAALGAAGIVLPSLREEIASPYLALVALGSVRGDVAARLAEVVRKGAAR
jgi:hypothetical protein